MSNTITSTATVTIGLEEWLELLHVTARTDDDELKAAVEKALLSARSVHIAAVLGGQ